MYDTIWLLAYVFYLITWLVLPCWVIFQHQLPLVPSGFILGEQVNTYIHIDARFVFVKERLTFSSVFSESPICAFYVVKAINENSLVRARKCLQTFTKKGSDIAR